MENQTLVIGGFYRHFKGKMYQVRCIAKHSETKEVMVVYQALYGDYGIYVRPYEMFMSEVDHIKYPDVKQKYRFEQVNPDGTSVKNEMETVICHSLSEEQKTISVESEQNESQAAETNKVREETRQDTKQSHFEDTIVRKSKEKNLSENGEDNDNCTLMGKGSKIIFSQNQTEETEEKEESVDKEDTEDAEDVDEGLLMFLDADNYQDKLNTLTLLRNRLNDNIINAMAASMDVEVPDGPMDIRYNSLRNCILAHAKYEGSRLR